MKFEQFKQKDLIGKYVLWISGTPSRKIKQVKKIVKIIKSGFFIEDEPSRVFSYYTGEQVAGSNKTKCELIDDSAVDRIKSTVDSDNRKEELIQILLNSRIKLSRLDLGELESIVSRVDSNIGPQLVTPATQPQFEVDSRTEQLNKLIEQYQSKLRAMVSMIISEQQDVDKIKSNIK